MMKMRSVTLLLAGCVWLGTAGFAAGQVPPAAPVPPVAPAAPVAPRAPLPPLRPLPPIDVEAWSIDLPDLSALQDSLRDLRDQLDVNPFPDRFAFQIEKPKSKANPDPSPFPVWKIPSPPIRTTGADGLYDSAHGLINSGHYDKAIDQLNRLIQQYDGRANAVENRVDAALYWKAYAQLKADTLTDALSTLSDLQKRFADSRWLKDAKALEVEVRQASGQTVSPETQADEELKLMALRGLMQTDPDRAIPMIEQLMAGNSSVRVKENALFVLSQSRAARASEIIGKVARTGTNPDVQLRAVRYLGAMRTTDSRQIFDELYRTTTDSALKRTIIQSYVATDALDRLTEIARNEKDLPLRRSVIRSVGAMGRAKTGDVLRSLYTSDSSGEVRKDIIGALSLQQNAPVLVELAKVEKNPDLKREIVSKLSQMKAKEATDYMLELLK